MILVTGATGANGSELLKLLSARGVLVRAMVRGPAMLPPGVSPAVADFDAPASLALALQGVERAFLLTPSTARAEARQLAFVEAARRAGVRHVVKLSQYAASPASPVRFLRYHAAVERALQASGMAWTVLRPNLFMQGVLHFAPSIHREGRFHAAAGDAAVSAVDVRDIALAAAAALTGEGHEGRTYTLTGPAALTHAGMAAALSEVAGRPVAYVDVPEAAMCAALLGMGMDPWQVEGLAEDYAHYRRGEAAEVAAGVQEAAGVEPRAFGTFARDHAGAWS